MKRSVQALTIGKAHTQEQQHSEPGGTMIGWIVIGVLVAMGLIGGDPMLALAIAITLAPLWLARRIIWTLLSALNPFSWGGRRRIPQGNVRSTMPVQHARSEIGGRLIDQGGTSWIPSC